MIKQEKVYIYSAIIIFTLLIILFIALVITDSKWDEGIYPLENDTVIYSKDSPVKMQIGLIVVGDDFYSNLYDNETEINLIGQEETVKANYQVTATLEKTNYYYVELLLSCDLSKGSHEFTDFAFKHKSDYSEYKPLGNICVNVIDSAGACAIEGVDGEVITLRIDYNFHFLYCISNTTSNDIEILDIIGELNHYKDIGMTMLPPTDLDIESISLLEGESYTYPVIVPSQKKVYFICNVKMADEKNRFTYLNLFPYVRCKKVGEGDIYHLFLRDSGSLPFNELTAEEVYSFICRDRGTGMLSLHP